MLSPGGLGRVLLTRARRVFPGPCRGRQRLGQDRRGTSFPRLLTLAPGLIAILCGSTRPAAAQWALEWQARAVPSQSFPVALALDSAGAAHVTGTLTANDYATVKFGTNGGQRWFSRFDSGVSSSDNASDLAVDATGHVYVTGSSGFSGGSQDIATVKYDAAGAFLWAARYPAVDGLQASATRIALAGADGVVVAGIIAAPGAAPDFAIVKYDTDGNQLWAAQYDGPAHAEDFLSAVTTDGAGNVYVTGRSRGLGTQLDFATVKYAPDGHRLWTARYDDANHRDDVALALMLDPAGNVYVAGHSRGVLSASDSACLVVVKYNPDGQQLWAVRHLPAAAESVELAAGAIDRDGRLHLAGTAYADDIDTVLVTYDSNGQLLWEARHSGPRNSMDYTVGLALDDAGNSFLTGYSTGVGAASALTLAFNPAGHRIWVAPDQDVFDFPVAVRASPAGHIHVTGPARDWEDGGFVLINYVPTNAPGLPVLVAPPQAQTVAPGSNATFRITAAGPAPLTYQWRHQGRTISGATNTAFTVSAARFEQRGGYSVEVHNAAGSVASPEARLTVLAPPVLTSEPGDQLAFPGTQTSLTVAALGLEPFTYQWRHDGSNIPGAAAGTLILTNLQLADAGGYSVDIANAAGSVTSRTALLTIAAQVHQAWATRYRGPAGGKDTSPRIVLNPAGRVLLAGASQGADTGIDFVTAKYDGSGDPLWVSRFNSAGDQIDFPIGLALDGAGRVAVAGRSRAADSYMQFTTVSYEANGMLRWQQHPIPDEAVDADLAALAVDQAGNVYVTGSSLNDGVTIKYDPAGNQVWRALFDSGSFDLPQGVAVNAAGQVYVGVLQDDFFNGNYLVVKYGADGQELWRTNYDSGGSDRLFGLKLDDAGNVYVTGQIPGDSQGDSGSDTSDLATVKFSPDGRLLWVSRYRGVQHSRETPVAFAVDGAGNSWIAFTFDIPGGGTAIQHLGLIKVAPDGRHLWLAALASPEMSSISDLALDAGGNAYLTGLAYRGATGADVATMKFDGEGSRLWTVYYDAGAASQDYGTSLALDHSGGIFVAGVSSFDEYDADIVLLKYQQTEVPDGPAITTPPRDVVTAPGSNVTFSVSGTGLEPLRYQWRFNGTNIADATNSSLRLANVQLANEGLYDVEVLNPHGQLRSADARLSLVPLPLVQAQPTPQSTVVGADIALAVAASGSDLTFQWRLNGAAIADATNAILIVTNAQAAQSGEYTVVIASSGGAILSQPARLTVSLAAARCQQLDYATGGLTQNAMITRDPAGNLYVAGLDRGEGDNANYLTLKYSPAGQLLWEARYDFPGGGGDYPTAIAADGSGNVYVTGISLQAESPDDADFATVKYDSQGHQVWARRYDSTNGNDFAAALAVDADGNVLVIGSSQRVGPGGPGGPNGTAWLTLKYSPDGTQLWLAEYRGPGQRFDRPRALSVDATGNIFVTGSSDGTTYDGHFATIKYDPSGHALWEARYEQVSGGASALARDSAGHIIVAGWSITSSGNEIVTVKYDVDGTQLWAVRSHDPAQKAYSSRAVAVDALGNIVVTGESGGDILTLKYDPEGHPLWASRLDGPSYLDDDVPRDIALDPDGNVYVTGVAAGLVFGQADLVTIKYDTAGSRLWVARQTGGSYDLLHSGLVLDDAGAVDVVGAIGSTLTTIKYCPGSSPALPGILVPPQHQAVVLGSTAGFNVVPSGTEPVSYQWRFNGQAIAGAATATLNVSNAQLSDAGRYSVQLFNPSGSVVSADATLTVYLPPTIVASPVDVCVIAGGVARFSVSTAGDSPISYQWSFAGVELSGANGATLILSNVQPSQAGAYTVRASNPFGSATAGARLSLVPNVQQSWARLFDNVDAPPVDGSSPADSAAVSAIDSAGNLYLAGSSARASINDPHDLFVLKYDAAGALQWVAHHGASNNATRWAAALAVNAEGEVYFGVEDYSSTNAPALLKYSANGQLLWTARFDDAGGFSTARRLTLDSAGNVYVIQTAFRVMKVTPDGTRLWTAAHHDAFAMDVAVDGAGNVYVGGAAFAPGVGSDRADDYLAVRFNSAGVEQWSRTFRPPLGGDNFITAIAVDHANNLIATGYYAAPSPTSPRGQYNIGTFKYDPDGNALWFADYGAPDSTDTPVALQIDAADNVLIAGSSADFQYGSGGWATLKYSPDGNLRWAKEFSLGFYNANIPAGLALDATGNAYVSGAVLDESFQPAITTIKYSPAGDERWTARFLDGSFSGINYDSYSVGVQVDAAGRVLVAGSVGRQDILDVIALSYAQEPSPDAPVIIGQPQALTVAEGEPAMFSVIASNAARFQWRYNGTAILGATSPVLLLPAALPEQAGIYSVLVENGDYCLVSDPARLFLQPPARPRIVAQLFRTEGGFELHVVAAPYTSYTVETSSDLLNWENIGTFYHDGGTTQVFVDSNPSQVSQRFYRVTGSGD